MTRFDFHGGPWDGRSQRYPFEVWWARQPVLIPRREDGETVVHVYDYGDRHTTEDAIDVLYKGVET